MGFTAVKFGWDPIDAGLVWDAKTAIQRAHAFAEANIFWLEEPLRPDDYEGYRKLSQATTVRIAAGEAESNRLSYIDLMDRGLPVANHGFTTYINVAAALHWLNSVPNALICEFVAEAGTTLRDKLTRQTIRARDGYLQVPQEPGLGIDLNEDAIREYRLA
jgi:L-rhamnonate dehydratase